ncbi:MAG: Fur family transcriptional regulator [Anaerolineae bacterium]
MSCGNQYAPELRARGFRVTPQRMAVLHVLRHSGQRLTPAEVYRRAHLELPRLTETTVYRTLDFLARNGFAWPTRIRTGRLVYEIAGRQHHHLICRQCGAEIEVEHALMRSLYTKLEAASGYHLADEHLTLFGVCPDCQKAAVGRRA